MREELLQVYAFRKLGYGKNLVLLGTFNKEFVYDELPTFEEFEKKFNEIGSSAISVGDEIMIALKPNGVVEYQCTPEIKKSVTIETAKLRARLK